MLLPSHRKWFVIGAIGLTAAVWGFGRPVLGRGAQDGPQVTITPAAKPAPKEEVLPKSRHPLGCQPGPDSGDRHRSHESLRHGTRKRILQGIRGQETADHHAIFERRCAALGGSACSIAAAAWAPKLKESREAVAQFFKTANPEDEAFLVQFHDTADLVHGLHQQPGGDPEPPAVHQFQGHDGAAGRHLPGHARDEKGEESA